MTKKVHFKTTDTCFGNIIELNVDVMWHISNLSDYLFNVTDPEEAVKAVKVFVEKQKQAGRLQYLPNMETVLNNAMWENWVTLIDTAGEEQKDWNEESI